MRRRLFLVPALLAAVMLLASASARADQTFTMFFHEWSVELDVPAREVLASAAALAVANPAMRVDVVGYASKTGSEKANLYLSLLRAQVVSDRLSEAGVNDARITRVGQGAVIEMRNEQASRRVDVVISTP